MRDKENKNMKHNKNILIKKNQQSLNLKRINNQKFREDEFHYILNEDKTFNKAYNIINLDNSFTNNNKETSPLKSSDSSFNSINIIKRKNIGGNKTEIITKIKDLKKIHQIQEVIIINH